MLRQNILNRPNNPNIANPIESGLMTEFECAALSLDVYMEEGRPALPLGWTQFMHKEYSTYYAGACYIKNIDNPTHIVFAHRGTQQGHYKDLWDDLKILREKVPYTHFGSAVAFFGEACNALLQKYGKEKLKDTFFAITGHSLGAVLADMTGLLGNWWPTVTFENPGSKPVIRQYYLDQGLAEDWIASVIAMRSKTCRTYLADMNIVNTCNEQVGQSFTVLPYDYNYFYKDYIPPAMKEISSHWFSSIYYIRCYSEDQHQIDSLYKKLKNGSEIAPVQYTFDLPNGYRAYLDYSLRKPYWDGYMKASWDKNLDLVQTKWNGNYGEFMDAFIEKLNIAHNKTLTLEDQQDENQHILLTDSTESKKKSSLIGQHSLFKNKDEKPELQIDDFVLVENDKTEGDTVTLNEIKAHKSCALM